MRVIDESVSGTNRTIGTSTKLPNVNQNSNFECPLYQKKFDKVMAFLRKFQQALTKSASLCSEHVSLRSFSGDEFS